MKNYKILLSAVLGVTILLTNLAVLADDDRAGVVTVARVEGTAEYSLDGGTTWIPALVGKSLPAGSLIRSDDRSIVDILVGQSQADRNVTFLKINNRNDPANNILPQREVNMIRLRPNTTFGIDKLTVPASDPTSVSGAEFNLKKGSILASVRKVSPSSEYFVKIPNGVAAVRGTQFSLSSDGSGSSCAVLSGTVWLSFTVTDANGNPILGPDGNPFPPVQITINPGQSFSLSQALIGQLSTTIMQSGSTGTSLQTLITQISTLATAAVETLESGTVNTLTLVLTGLQGQTITITGGVNNPTDPNRPPNITNQ
jgi:hypothetical protein